MNLTSTGNSEITTNANLATFNEVSGITYINPYKLCERCGKKEKNTSFFFHYQMNVNVQLQKQT